ncbi:putative two-component system response regulator [Streptomyces lincolnensis]|uniref:Putative two-component system response regulator n=1 Tax=Streptomyces lincolnensis TaxID=1915 RepID=A0A1B1MG95_STRLN|nr:response regulator transcription factor [Streptomyces lincolnensis]ANS67628.1 putative two-component system response regulator [Streptomyces lincolnensis]AXG54943.1 putative two-component system response regulator [Streptomyces lincolnensis]QMV09292.1 response regulator [Streptomyces lincolnensis]
MRDRPTPAPGLRVVVADDNPVVRAGLTALLSGRPDITVVAEAADGHQACEAARRHRPDVVLLDVRMPRMDGISALPHLVTIAPVLMLTYSTESEIVREALRRGADGYLVHGEFTADQLVTAVRDVRQGRPHFTPTAAGTLLAQLRATLPEPFRPQMNPLDSPGSFSKTPSRLQPSMGQSSREGFRLSTREAEIMDLIASGMSNQQIAAMCFISQKTVKNHINRIFAKLHSASRSEATAKWLGTAPTPRLGLG